MGWRDTLDKTWEDMFGRLGEYKQKHGDCLVPRSYGDRKLSKWVNGHRNNYKKGRLEPIRIQRLENLGFVWDARGESWEEMFGRLAEYKQNHGNCQVPLNYSDKELANWVNNQRVYKNTGKADPSRIQRLNELGFVWDAISESWENMFSRLVAYKKEHGNCLVPQNYSDTELANWVSNRRILRNRGKLEPSRIQQLNELGFVWDARGASWDEMFCRLAEYKLDHGDCVVPTGYSDRKLVNWVSTQRVYKNTGKLDPIRIQRLEELGFVWKAGK